MKCFDEFLKFSNTYVDPMITLETFSKINWSENFKLQYEFIELFIRTRSLNNFIDQCKDEIFNVKDLNCSLFLLEEQLETMVKYLKILNIRADAINLELMFFIKYNNSGDFIITDKDDNEIFKNKQ